MSTIILEKRFQHAEYYGDGYLAGDLPPDPNPDELDGRSKILNVPSRIKIAVLERSSMICVASTLSAADGTWRIEHLDRNRQFLVLGYDGRSLVNAAVQDCITPAEME